jgi:ATP-dependent 26S proteasome regulatory subunit
MINKFDLSFSSYDTNFFIKQFIKELLNNINNTDDNSNMKQKDNQIICHSKNSKNSKKLKHFINYLDTDKKHPIYVSTNKRNDISDLVSDINMEYERSYNFDIYGQTSSPSIKLIKDEISIIEKEKVIVDMEINNLQDLLNLIEKYPLSDNIEYNVNLAPIHNIKENLVELNNMIGMEQLKTSIIDQILYFVQDLHAVQTKNSINCDFMHTVIYGPPGTGKTEIAKIMGGIYSKLGLLKKGTYRKVTRSDMIAGYLGQTSLKTRDLIKENLDGVLFIDEAYALGNKETKDSFAKECIDTLCEALSDYKDRIMVIIAGYEDELKECFFKYNKGLESRFIWRFNTDDYSPEELMKIFIKKVNDAGWSLKDDIKIEWFETKMDYFKYYGRDMETLFTKTKIAHAKRVFLKSKDDKTKIIMKDLDKGFEMYITNEEVKSRKENNGSFNNTMYM